MNLPIIEGLTDEEQSLYSALISVWRKNLAQNQERRMHFSGKLDVASLDLGISVPPPIIKRLRRQPVMWVRKAVVHLGDCSVFDGFAFMDDLPPAGFADTIGQAGLVNLYDEAKISELIHCAAFWTVTPGADGEEPVVINAYDAEHAAGLWDFRHRRLLCGMAVVDVDPKKPNRPTAVNLYMPDSVIECYVEKGIWKSKRHPHKVGRPLMEPMRFDPEIGKPFGRSCITPAIMELEKNACREVVKMVMHSEVYTTPTRWIMGAPDDIFENGRAEAYFGSMFALPRDINGDAPTTGSYAVTSMEPHISLMRQYASMFAAESSIPVHSLLYTEANPSSSDAIIASETDLVRRAEDMNRRNGEAMRNVGLLALSLLTETPFYELDEQALSMKAKWKPAAHPSIASTADAWTKLAKFAPHIAQTRVFWEQQGLDETTVDRIMSDTRRNGAVSALDALNSAVKINAVDGEQDGAHGL